MGKRYERNVTKEDIPAASEYMKKMFNICCHQKIKIKTIHPPKWPKVKRLPALSADQDAEQPELLYTAMGINGTDALKNSVTPS